MSVRVLGIDPGTRLTGFGCVERRAVKAGRDVELVDAGVLRLNAKAPLADRLFELDTDLHELIARLKPDVLSVEMVFTHVKHPTTAAIMGHARGVILLAARRASLTLVELRPTEIKKSMTGHGHAAKGQIQRAVQHEFGLPAPPTPADVADAIAIALCAARRRDLGP